MLEQVEVFCPHCFANYYVSPERIPEEGVTAPCKKCRKTFTMVKASGDTVRDRANRQQGFVVVHGKRRRDRQQNIDGVSSRETARRKSTGSVLFRKKSFKLGVGIAGILLAVVLSSFCLWKSSLHTRFEKSLRNTLAQTSDSRFEFKLERATFSTFGGLTRSRGSLYGLALMDREAQRILYYADKIHFQIDPSKKHFVTEPFTVRVNVTNSKIILNGCIFEANASNGWHATLRAKEATAEIGGTDVLTGQDLEFTLGFKGGDWSTDHRFVLGDVDLGLKVKLVESLSASISKDVDLLFTLKNALFPKQADGAPSGFTNYSETMRTKWGESRTVAKIDRCSLNILGAAVQLEGKAEFRNPLAESEVDLSFRSKDFSRIMKFIHRLNRETFDWMVAALVDLDEKNISLYAPNTDCLDLNLSYKTSKITINEQELKPLISSARAELL